jgi:ketosteroid isomerase-like protein
VIRQMFECIDRADWEHLSDCFDLEICYKRPGFEPMLGRDRLMRFYREERHITEPRHVVEGVLLGGDDGAAWGRMTGRREAGDAVALEFAEIYRFAGGVVRARRSYFFTPTV